MTKPDKKSKNAAYTSLLAAIAASSCCIPPVIALVAGIGGGASSLSWMEPFRPYLIAFSVLAIAYAWYNYYQLKTVDNCGCVTAKPKKYQTKGFLIGITVFATISIGFPYYAKVFYSNAKAKINTHNFSNVKSVEFKIKGMTCVVCEEHINHAVNQLKGIVKIETSFDKGNTQIQFDSLQTTLKDIRKAIKSTGYSVSKLSQPKSDIKKLN